LEKEAEAARRYVPTSTTTKDPYLYRAKNKATTPARTTTGPEMADDNTAPFALTTLLPLADDDAELTLLLSLMVPPLP
jgi:hypothetical protein